MPAHPGRRRGLGGPAYENLQGRKPRGVASGRAAAGDLSSADEVRAGRERDRAHWSTALWCVSGLLPTWVSASSDEVRCASCDRNQAFERAPRRRRVGSGAPSCLICLTARQRETERHPKSRQDEHWLGFAWFLTATNADMSCLAVSRSVSHGRLSCRPGTEIWNVLTIFPHGSRSRIRSLMLQGSRSPAT